MHPYSLDLRQKVIAAYENHEGSQRQLASRFKVSLGFIQNLLNRYRTDGTIEPRPMGKGFAPKLAEYKEDVRILVEQNPDATLQELTIKLEQNLGVQVSISTLHYFLQELKLTRKKNSSRRSS